MTIAPISTPRLPEHYQQPVYLPPQPLAAVGPTTPTMPLHYQAPVYLPEDGPVQAALSSSPLEKIPTLPLHYKAPVYLPPLQFTPTGGAAGATVTASNAGSSSGSDGEQRSDANAASTPDALAAGAGKSQEATNGAPVDPSTSGAPEPANNGRAIDTFA